MPTADDEPSRPDPAGRTRPGSANSRAILAMIGATAVFTCGDAAMKVVSADLPTGETIVVRAAVSLVVLVCIGIGTGALRSLRHALVPTLGWRCVGDMGGAVFFQAALARMKLADIMGILQLTPLALTAASALFLAEKVGWRRWTAVAVGFCGALLVIKPGSSAFNVAALIAMLAVLSGTLRDVSTRRLDRAISPVVILICSQTCILIAGLGFGLFETWSRPSVTNLANLVAASFCSMIGQGCLIYSVRAGELSAVAPFRYTGMLWAILIGFVLWRELPDPLTAAGIAILVAAGLYTLYREQYLRRQRAGARAK